MNYYYDITNPQITRFIEDEYIPVTVQINDTDLNKHIGFYFEKTDLAEFGVDYNTNSINRFVLTFSDHYEFRDTYINVPEAENSEIKLYYPSQNLCSVFAVVVFCNGVQISISEKNAVKYLRTGQLVIGVDDSDNISEIFIDNLSAENISFIKNELLLG